ncbi:MAG: LPS-assembly protein LptD [Alphaproteobacteria bacterium]|nr:LPS-assembly protein LptD [Alphaproteobacteria bacterium]
MARANPLRAGASVIAVMSALLALPAWAADAPPNDRGDQILLKADRITYDSTHDVVTAEGHVEIDAKARILLAKKLVYDEKSGQVTAEGKVSLLAPNGDVAFADHVVLTHDLRDGALSSFRALIGKSGRVVASSARKEGSLVVARNAAYTPCELCVRTGHTTPTWALKASKVVYDQSHHRIYYHDALVELWGVPVLYSPILSHPDPSVKHLSGFLRPSAGTSSSLGSFVLLPYYIAINDTQDATIEPMITSQAGEIVRGEYRQRFNDGGMWLQPAAGYAPSSGKWGWQSSLFGAGRIPLGDIWHLGYGIALTSSQTFLKRYNISNDVTLDNDLFLEALSGRSRLMLSGYYFQDLREGRVSQSEIPFVLPAINYTYIPRHPVAGGQFRFNVSSASIMRNVGANDERLSTQVRWQLPLITPDGQLITLTADARAELWRVAGDKAYPSLVTDLQGNPIPAGVHYINRAQPMFVADWRWPFIAEGHLGHSYVLQPIAQLIAAPYGGNPAGIPNEDSTDFELDDTDIFSADRMPGYSLWESGPRANVGLEAEAFFPGGSIEGLVGQVLRPKADRIFGVTSGLYGTNSDIVTRYRVRFLPYLSLTQRLDLNPKNGTVDRNEVYFDGTWGRSNLDVSYIRLDRQAVSLGAPREEINGALTLGIGTHWSAFAAARRDLQNSQMLDTEFGIGWQNDCLGLSIAYQRRYTRFLDVAPSTSILFTIVPKFGGDSDQNVRLFPRNVFAAPVQAAAVP